MARTAHRAVDDRNEHDDGDLGAARRGVAREWQAGRDFSRHEGYAASTLRWWSSKLRHELPAAPEVRLARVVRTAATVPAPTPSVASLGAVIAIDVTATGARIVVGPGTDRETLAMVLDVVRAGAAR